MFFARAASNINAHQITNRLFYTERGQLMVSILFGVALAFMFQKSCRGDKCVVLEPPVPSELAGKVFKVGDACYRYEPRLVPCASATHQ